MSSAANRNRINVRIGEVAVAGAGESLVAIGLGSCVAVTLYDAAKRLGGLAHVMLPDPERARTDVPPARFASAAVRILLERMHEQGAAEMVARLIGGAAMFDAVFSEGTGNIGRRNIAACRAALEKAAVPIVAEDVGGNYGRTVTFNVANGEIRVSTVLHGELTI